MTALAQTFPCEISIDQWRHETDAITIKSLTTGRTLSRYRWQDTSSIRSFLDRVNAPFAGGYGCTNVPIELTREEMNAFKNLRP